MTTQAELIAAVAKDAGVSQADSGVPPEPFFPKRAGRYARNSTRDTCAPRTLDQHSGHRSAPPSLAAQ